MSRFFGEIGVILDVYNVIYQTRKGFIMIAKHQEDS